MPNDSTGTKYEETKSLDIAAVAKLVRADVKALLGAGFKTSVRIQRFSGGQSISIDVTAVPAGFQYWTDEYLASDPHRFFEGTRLTAEARVVTRALERVLGAYNYDRSDIQSDYFNVRFYGHVDFASKITSADRAARVQVAA